MPAEGGVEKHALQEVEIGVASAAGANIVSIYVYFTESLLSGEPPTLGLAGAGKFFCLILVHIISCILTSRSTVFFVCANEGMNLVAKQRSETAKAVVDVAEDPWARFARLLIVVGTRGLLHQVRSLARQSRQCKELHNMQEQLLGP